MRQHPPVFCGPFLRVFNVAHDFLLSLRWQPPEPGDELLDPDRVVGVSRVVRFKEVCHTSESGRKASAVFGAEGFPMILRFPKEGVSFPLED